MLTNNALKLEQKEDSPDLQPADFFTGEISGRLLIDADNLCKCLSYHGWRRHNGLYARIERKTLIQGDRGDLIRHLSELMNKGNDDFTHAVMKNLIQLTTPTALELLPQLNADLLRDDKDHIRLPYLNGILQIGKNGLNLLPYSEMNCFVWQHKIIQREFHPVPESDFTLSPWYRFLAYTCTRPKRIERCDDIESRVESFDTDRFNALKATIGKMIHTYNNPSKPVAVIFTDETGWDDENSGGTGKSLIAESIKYLRKGITIQCRDKKKGDAFFFDSVTGDIDLLILDDLDSAVMAFSQLYGYLTGGLEVNRKGEHHFKYAFEDNPRFVITTNQAVKGSDISDVRRRWDMQLLPFFDLGIQPKDINQGENFFENWSPTDWLYFDNVMAECCLQYFQSAANDLGCPNFESNTTERSIRQEIGNEAVDWLDCYKADLSEQNIYEAVEALIEFRERFNEETKSRVKNAFTKILKKWAFIRKVSLQINQERYLNKSQKVIRMNWLGF